MTQCLNKRAVIVCECDQFVLFTSLVCLILVLDYLICLYNFFRCFVHVLHDCRGGCGMFGQVRLLSWTFPMK